MDITKILPLECISHIISFTSPRDACRSSLVSPTFNSASNSSTVWERFLPPDYQDFISSSSSSSSLNSLTKKDLYFHLCDHPILIGNSNRSFALEKGSGKKCLMVGARGLWITWGDISQYWTWTSLPESRFSEVAELNYVWWLQIKGSIDNKLLALDTTYAAYFVFKFAESCHGFEQRPVELKVHFEGRENGNSHIMYLDPPANMPNLTRVRGDGWIEIKMGEFINEHADDGNVVFSVFDFDGGSTKGGLIVEGIELRPTSRG
ncbi:putative F-box protein PP2-B12 [Fagus crenata]